jgi:hypothetical protein
MPTHFVASELHKQYIICKKIQDSPRAKIMPAATHNDTCLSDIVDKFHVVGLELAVVALHGAPI